MTDDSPTPAANNNNNQQKLLILGGLAFVLLALGVLYVLWAGSRESGDLADRQVRAQDAVEQFEAQQSVDAQNDPPPSVAAPTVRPEVAAGLTAQPGEVLVVHRVPGDDYGRLAIRHADGTRTLLERRCLRVHIAADHGVCLSQDPGVVPQFTTTFFESINPNVEIKSYPSALPSRARISPEGNFSSVTAFVTGSSYVDIGSETTTLVTIDEIESSALLRGARQFEVTSDEPRFNNRDPQFWGMSFVDESEIYITGFYGENPEIMRGSIDDMTIEPTGWIGSCPSVSPDGKTLVFKEMLDNGEFELVAVDIESQAKWKLGETNSVDDQVEWLDNDTILYARHPEGGDTPVQPEFDIWMLDIAEGSEPVLFLPNADSPAVAR